MSTDDDIRRRIMAKVNCPVRFKYPGTEGHKRGFLRGRVTVKSNAASSGVRYWDVVDLLEFPDEAQKVWIRFGYYRQDGERLRWAGQTSLAEPVENMRRLFEAGVQEAGWFRQLITGLEGLAEAGSPPR